MKITLSERQVVNLTRIGRSQTQAKFAQALSTTQATIGYWESGSKRVSSDRLSEWLADNRLWVRVFAKQLWNVRHGRDVALMERITDE
jgi:transcriptional regulator with XRE-family HTH domain